MTCNRQGKYKTQRCMAFGHFTCRLALRLLISSQAPPSSRTVTKQQLIWSSLSVLSLFQVAVVAWVWRERAKLFGPEPPLAPGELVHSRTMLWKTGARPRHFNRLVRLPDHSPTGESAADLDIGRPRSPDRSPFDIIHRHLWPRPAHLLRGRHLAAPRAPWLEISAVGRAGIGRTSAEQGKLPPC